MFLVKVESISGHVSDLKTPPDRNKQVIEKNNTRITVICRKPYAFMIKTDSGCLVGESVQSVPDSSIRAFCNSTHEVAAFHRGLPDDLMVLLSVSATTGRVLIANSIAGCRSYYYAIHDGTVWISSSLKLMASTGLPLAIDTARLPEFYAFRMVAPPQTLYANIAKMVAGQAIAIDLRSGNIAGQKFWMPPRTDNSAAVTEREHLSTIDSIMRQGMKVVCMEYRNPGLLLSGGADSSLLGAMGKKVVGSLSSMSTGFSFLNRQEEEARYAVSMAKQLGIVHTVWETTAERYLSGLIGGIHAAEEPLSHLQSVLLYVLFSDYVADHGYDLTLNGIFADGLFGDDIHYAYFRNRDRISLVTKAGLHRIVKFLYRVTRHRIHRLSFLTNDFDDIIRTSDHILLKNGQYVDADYVKRYFNASDEQIFAARILHFNRYRDLPMLDKIMITTLMSKGGSTMEIWNNLAEDRGIASYYPFATPKLINYAAGIPWEIKLSEQKHMVRALLDQYGVPRLLIDRPKKSFGFPIRFWALPGTLFQPLVDLAADLYDARLLRRLQDGDYCNAMLLWNMLNVYIWRQLFEKNTSPDDLAREVLERYRTQEKKSTKDGMS